jgi:hypothetical protein
MAHDNGVCTSDASALMFCIRHGETHWNASEKLQGQMNVPLNLTGRQQAHAAGTYLAAHYSFGKGAKDIIISSDLDRAVETATIIGAVVGLPVFTHPLLRETSLGMGPDVACVCDSGCSIRDVRRRVARPDLERSRRLVSSGNFPKKT